VCYSSVGCVGHSVEMQEEQRVLSRGGGGVCFAEDLNITSAEQSFARSAALHFPSFLMLLVEISCYLAALSSVLLFFRS
jgi:hypothetical protein